MKIQELSEKLLNETLAPDELKELNSLLGEGDIAQTLEEFDEQWSKSAGVAIGAKPEKLIRKVQKEIRMRRMTERRESRSGRTDYPLWLNLLKYAAIVVLVALSSWFAFSHIYDIGNSMHDSVFLTVDVGNGSKSRIVLDDGTIVDLNAGSRLSYPSSAFRKNRHVRLEGEAYFNVFSDPAKPFFVYTEGMTVKALGTQFNVRAYPDEKTSETTLITGKVEVYSNTVEFEPDIALVVSLLPNQKVIMNRELKESLVETKELLAEEKKEKSAPVIRKNIRTDVDTEWRNDVLIFDNESFISIINKLERWYGVKIEKQTFHLDTVRFSGKFDRESISDVLYALSQIEPFTFEIHKDKVTLKTK